MSTPARLRVDEDDPTLGQYLSLDYPKDWNVLVGQRVPLGAYYNQEFELLPDLPWYGFLADDVVPETQEFDRLLIDTAGKDGMAVPAGGETTGGSPHFVLGGELVRSVGWLCLPGLDRIYIDTVWIDIAKSRGVYRYLPNVVLQHHHFSNGKALMDLTYRKRHKESDRRLYETWRQHANSS